MKKFIFVLIITFAAACTSENSNLTDDQNEFPDSTNDNNSTLPDNTVTDDEISEEDITVVEEDVEEVDDSSEEADETTEPDEDVDENYYAETCDCYGNEYTIPEQFREVKGWCKDDADSDGIPNCIEAIDGEFTNSDTDADPDYLDTDSDNDGIPDSQEGYEDIDKDGLNNYRDPDSDNDQVEDSIECPSTPCVDSDGDTIVDFLDSDSDNDGLTDKQEKDFGTNRLNKDSDDDGFDDLAEVTYGSNPLDDQDGIPEEHYYVVLPYDAPDDELRTLKFKTDVEKVDILILLDRSSSMSGEIDNLKLGINSEIVTNISANITDAGFGLATFDDWKALNGDTIFSLVQPITTSTTDIQTAVNGISNLSSCGWEPHHEALYQVADGTGYIGEFTFTKRESSVNACDVDDTYYPSIPAADCSSSDGSIGGACFRNEAMPIIIMLSDEGFTTFPEEVFAWTIDYHDKTDAIAALNDINAKFIGVDSWDSAMTWTPAPENDFKEISTATGSVSATTGEPFFYKINSDGSGLSAQIKDAVMKLTSNIKLDVWTISESVTNPQSVDTSKFVKSLTPFSSDPVNSYDSKDMTTFYAVNPGAKVNFEIKFHNSIYEPTKLEATVFKAKINVLGDGALLDTREVIIIVPGSDSRDTDGN